MHSTIHIVNVEDGSLCSSYYGFPDWINSIEYFDGTLIAGGDNNCLKLLKVDKAGIIGRTHRNLTRTFQKMRVRTPQYYAFQLVRSCVFLGQR